MEESNALVLEISRQEETLAMSIFEQKELASTLRHYSQLAVSFPEIDKLCQEMIAILNKATPGGILESDALQNLRKIGQLLWDQLLTRIVKDRLKSTIIKDLILSIDEKLVHIPWELLYDAENFLCLKFNLGRLIRTKDEIRLPQYRSHMGTPRMLILANPTNDLRSAYLEGVYIKNQFDRRRNEISINFKSTSIDTLYVKKNLRDYDIVHFAGHCEYDTDNQKNMGWLLNDGKFTPSDILKLAQSSPLPSLIFSNACHSARAASGLTDADYQEKNYSLASAFLFSGVRHYIGTTRKIEDPVSLIFAKEFYTQLIRGSCVGECVRLGRLKLIKEYGIAGVSWMSYLLYGNPSFILFKPKHKPQALKFKRKASLYKKPALAIASVALIVSLCIPLYAWLPTINPNTYLSFAKSHKLYLKGDNQKVILLCGQIIEKEPLFLQAYPLLADTYQRQGDREKALKYYFDYALYSEKKNNKKHLSCAYIGIGWIYHLQGEYSKAFDFYNKAIRLSSEGGDKLNEAIALRKLAVWYIDKEDNDKALELLMKSSEINRERKYLYEHRYNLACDYFDIGLVFTNKDDFAAARDFYHKGLKLFEKLKLKGELSDYYFNLGEIYAFEKQYQKAIAYYFKGLAIDQRQQNKPNIAGDYGMIGELYMEMDNFADAERFLKQSVLAGKEINARPELASAFYSLGVLYEKRGRRNKAKDYLRQAQEIYGQMGTPEYQEIKEKLSEFDNPSTN
ncbi:MAG: tetratricopeptide repeat protein [Candidatus Omnitrophica bacterium]|nr:tetratricopeptide repeat protein [Candidatus Omnitrophota bacterium]MDD5592039.1 tetratricopeptide repeat protein [Candidatus Omnitrophota bacterium]